MAAGDDPTANDEAIARALAGAAPQLLPRERLRAPPSSTAAASAGQRSLSPSAGRPKSPQSPSGEAGKKSKHRSLLSRIAHAAVPHPSLHVHSDGGRAGGDVGSPKPGLWSGSHEPREPRRSLSPTGRPSSAQDDRKARSASPYASPRQGQRASPAPPSARASTSALPAGVRASPVALPASGHGASSGASSTPRAQGLSPLASPGRGSSSGWGVGAGKGGGSGAGAGHIIAQSPVKAGRPAPAATAAAATSGSASRGAAAAPSDLASLPSAAVASRPASRSPVAVASRPAPPPPAAVASRPAPSPASPAFATAPAPASTASDARAPASVVAAAPRAAPAASAPQTRSAVAECASSSPALSSPPSGPLASSSPPLARPQAMPTSKSLYPTQVGTYDWVNPGEPFPDGSATGASAARLGQPPSSDALLSEGSSSASQAASDDDVASADDEGPEDRTWVDSLRGSGLRSRAKDDSLRPEADESQAGQSTRARDGGSFRRAPDRIDEADGGRSSPQLLVLDLDGDGDGRGERDGGGAPASASLASGARPADVSTASPSAPIPATPANRTAPLARDPSLPLSPGSILSPVSSSGFSTLAHAPSITSVRLSEALGATERASSLVLRVNSAASPSLARGPPSRFFFQSEVDRRGSFARAASGAGTARPSFAARRLGMGRGQTSHGEDDDWEEDAERRSPGAVGRGSSTSGGEVAVPSRLGGPPVATPPQGPVGSPLSRLATDAAAQTAAPAARPSPSGPLSGSSHPDEAVAASLAGMRFSQALPLSSSAATSRAQPSPPTVGLAPSRALQQGAGGPTLTQTPSGRYVTIAQYQIPQQQQQQQQQQSQQLQQQQQQKQALYSAQYSYLQPSSTPLSQHAAAQASPLAHQAGATSRSSAGSISGRLSGQPSGSLPSASSRPSSGSQPSASGQPRANLEDYSFLAPAPAPLAQPPSAQLWPGPSSPQTAPSSPPPLISFVSLPKSDAAEAAPTAVEAGAQGSWAQGPSGSAPLAPRQSVNVAQYAAQPSSHPDPPSMSPGVTFVPAGAYAAAPGDSASQPVWPTEYGSPSPSSSSSASFEQLPPDSLATSRERLSDRLETYCLEERVVVGDGNCQFRALADQLYGDQGQHAAVRRAVADKLRLSRAFYAPYVPGDYDQYVRDVATDGTWGDHVTLQAAADALGVGISLITSFEDAEFVEIEPRGGRSSSRVLWLSFWAEFHYNSLYSKGEAQAGPAGAGRPAQPVPSYHPAPTAPPAPASAAAAAADRLAWAPATPAEAARGYAPPPTAPSSVPPGRGKPVGDKPKKFLGSRMLRNLVG